MILNSPMTIDMLSTVQWSGFYPDVAVENLEHSSTTKELYFTLYLSR